MNNGGLRKKLLVSHVGVAVSALLTVVLLVNLVMSFSFGKYMNNQQQAEADTLIKDLAASFNDATGEWESGVFMSISHQAMLRDYSVRIYDPQQKLVWDTDTMGMSMHAGESGTKNSEAAKDSGSIRQAITKNGRQIGTLEIQGISGSSQNLNRQFLRTFNTLLWAVLIVVIAGAYLFSVFVAGGISRPLIRIRQIAVKMKEGDLSSRVAVVGQTTEIGEVGLALNHLADALEQQDKLRKTLTADVAHELRTPITTIQSHLEAFQDGIWEATPDKLQICHDQVMRLAQLISDLENLAAVENPMLQLREETVCLNEIIHQSLDTVAGQFKDKPVAADVDEHKKVLMTGDYTRLVQVFINLLSNAYKYTNSGSIHVVISQEEEVRVSIKDTGMGIAAEELPYIFERFYRGEKSRNRKTGGAGIGLAVVKAIIEAHKGNITVSSKPGQGTEVTVRFPGNKTERMEQP